MTPVDLSTAYVPVLLRWRHVLGGDVFVSPDGRMWSVGAVGPNFKGSGLHAATYCGAHSWRGDVDPDDVIPVLVPVAERDAVELTIEQLGARLIERAPLKD